MFNVSHSETGPASTYSARQLEQVFDFQFLPSITFDQYATERWIRKKCALAYRQNMIPSLSLWLGQLHHLWLGPTPPASPFYLRWVSPSIGYGLFASRSLQAWECIGEYSGVVRRRAIHARDINDYCFVYPRAWISWKPYTIDSEKRGNLTRFMNHSFQPNVEAVAVFYEGLFHIILRTLRKVQPEEELRYDYGVDYWKPRAPPEH